MKYIEIVSFPPEHYVVEQEGEAGFMYFVKDGELAVKVRDENHLEEYVNLLRPGSIFGEVSLISNCRRTATVECRNYCTMAQLSSSHFKEMCKKFPDVLKKLKDRRSEYMDTWKIFVRKLVLNVPYFRHLEGRTIEELIYSIKSETFNENDVIVKSGADINKIRFVAEGKVIAMLRLDDGSEVQMDTL